MRMYFRTGKIKGIERFLGAVDTLEAHLIEVTSGHAKYEHHHRSIVWRMSRLPKEGQGKGNAQSELSYSAGTHLQVVTTQSHSKCGRSKSSIYRNNILNRWYNT